MSELSVNERIKRLAGLKTFSERDGCYVAIVSCSRCRVRFSEEFEHSLVLAVSGLPNVCIRCEGASADTPSISKVLVGILASQ